MAVDGLYRGKSSGDLHEVTTVTEENQDSLRSASTLGESCVVPGNWIFHDLSKDGKLREWTYMKGENNAEYCYKWLEKNYELVSPVKDLATASETINVVGNVLTIDEAEQIYAQLYKTKDFGRGAIPALNVGDKRDWWDNGNTDWDALRASGEAKYGGGDTGNWRAAFEDAFEKAGLEWFAEDQTLVYVEDDIDVDADEDSVDRSIEGLYVYKENRDIQYEIIVATKDNLEDLRNSLHKLSSNAVQPGRWIAFRAENRKVIHTQWFDGGPEAVEWFEKNLERIDGVDVQVVDAEDVYIQAVTRAIWPVPGDLLRPEDPNDCPVISPDSETRPPFFCTRSEGHNMPHIASDGATVVAVWDEDDYYVTAEGVGVPYAE